MRSAARLAPADGAPAAASDRLIRSLPTRSIVFDLVAAGLLLSVSLPVTLTQGPAAVIALVVLCAALAIRRISPALAIAVAWAGAIIQMVTLSDPGSADVAILAVLYATAAYGSRAIRWVGLASAGLGAVIATLYLVVVQPALRPEGGTVGPLPDGSRTWFVIAFFGISALALLGLSWTLGLLVRTARNARTARVEARIRQERAQYEVAVEQERTRIARDMHDVVAHSLAVVIAQADGARYAAAVDPAAQSSALATIATTARAALVEVRLLLAELRHDGVDGPQPVLDDIDRLVEQMRDAGMHIVVRRSGERRALGAGHEIAAYRIVQEALTNALRHGAPGSPVLLDLAWTDGALELGIENAVDPVDAGTARSGAGSSAVGHGLPGMRERAALAGGSVVASPVADDPGRFSVVATIPVPATDGAAS
ncbi:MAG: histidine kinase [Leifsonia sp.]